MGLDAVTLQTPRCLLRPFTEADAEALAREVGRREVAATTLNIPHPYTQDDATEWIATHEEKRRRGSETVFVIQRQEDGRLIGAIGLIVSSAHGCGEAGYWVSPECWGQGYCTEALRAVLRYGFEDLALERIEAHHFSNNPASGRVMEKCGMIFEGTMRQKVCKWGERLDTHHYAILRGEYEREARR